MTWSCRRAGRWLFAAGVLLSLAGCSVPKGEVAGKVSIDGEPLPGGLVTAYAPDGSTQQCLIQSGAFDFGNLPLGETVFTVFTSPPTGGPNPNDPPKLRLGLYKKIPGHYADKEKSGIKLDVKKGKQEFSIQLKGDPAE